MEKDLKSIFGTDHGLDEKSVNFLTKALAKNNLPGFDYLEFKMSLSKLAGMGIDENTAYRSAFGTASTMGLTREKLLKTAQHYREVIHKEQDAIAKATEQRIKRRVEGKIKEVENLREQVQRYREKIAQLQEQIRKSEETINSSDAVILEERSNIEDTKSKFDHTSKSILNQIDQDIKNIELHL